METKHYIKILKKPWGSLSIYNKKLKLYIYINFYKSIYFKNVTMQLKFKTRKKKAVNCFSNSKHQNAEMSSKTETYEGKN